MNKNYYIGLDIKAWGVRLFDEAQSAEERRLLRENRRRLERKKLKIIQQIL